VLLDHADGFDSALIVVWKTARHSPFVIRQMVAQLYTPEISLPLKEPSSFACQVTMAAQSDNV